MNPLTPILFLTALAATATAQEKVVRNVDKQGIALAGYDAVSYFSSPTPRRGDARFAATYLGAKYLFQTAEHRDLFRANPGKYAPQFGGYCGYGASRGYLAPVDPEAYTIMDGRLILQNSKSVLERWQKDPVGFLTKADRNWPEILAREGKPLP